MATFPMVSGGWMPLLALLGADDGNSRIDVTPEVVRFRFGPLDETVPRSDVVRVTREKWTLLGGIGWRWNFGERVGLISSLEGVVHIELRAPRPWKSFPFVTPRPRHVFVSLADPDGFLAELSGSAAT